MLRRVLFPGSTDVFRLRSGAVVRYVDGQPLDPVSEADASWMRDNWGPAVVDCGPWEPEPIAPPVEAVEPVADAPKRRTRKGAA